MYIRRQLEEAVLRASRFSPVIMVTGPRQSGKTTLLIHLSEAGRRVVSLDDLELRRLAREEPALFVERFPPPVLIDEFQYAPEILPYIKLAVDALTTTGRNAEAAGSYWLTGSQQFALMKNVRESLAGRVVILDLLGFSPAEGLRPATFDPDPILDQDLGALAAKQPYAAAYRGQLEEFHAIIQGSLPQAVTGKLRSEELRSFYSSYVQTYLERDVAALDGVRNLGAFERFLRLLAARTAQLVNFSELSREAGVSVNTIREWTSILQRSFHVLLLAPYYRSLSKRVVRTPKLYFLDSGLQAFLTGWTDPERALQGPLAGPMFENWVVGNVVRSFRHRGRQERLYFWRTATGQELDLWSESSGLVHTAEIRLSARLDATAFRPLARIDPSPARFGRRCLFTLSRELVQFEADTWNVPVHYIN